MASRLIVHIGVRKSGTSYLQYALSRSADTLASLDIRYPLASAKRSNTTNHERASYGLLSGEFPWVRESEATKQQQTWRRVRQEVAQWPGTVLLSAEALSIIRRQGIETLLDDLGVADVDIVVTTRQLGPLIASSWQQHIRNGRTSGIDRYLEDLAAERAMPRELVETELRLAFWRAMAFGRLVARWGGIVGPGRVHVVTSPGSPPELLWQRFTKVIGAPSLAMTPPPPMSDLKAHKGLTASEVTVLNAINSALDQSPFRGPAATRVRNQVIKGGFLERADRGPRVALPRDWRDRVAQWSREDVDELAASGTNIVGDLDDLRYDPARDDAPEVGVSDVTSAAAAAVLAVVSAESPPVPAATAGQATAAEPGQPAGPPRVLRQLRGWLPRAGAARDRGQPS
jgi:hypothetical protein